MSLSIHLKWGWKLHSRHCKICRWTILLSGLRPLESKMRFKRPFHFPCISNAIDVALLNAHCDIFSHFLREENRDPLKFFVSCIVQIGSWLTTVKNDDIYSKPALAFELRHVQGGNMQFFRLTSICLVRGWQLQCYSLCKNITLL